MKLLLLHAGIAVVAAALGWLAGTPSSLEAKNGRIRTVRPHPVPDGSPGTRAIWQVQLPALRAVPGALSEPAWVKWAFSIPDAEIPAAIAKLNPHSDIHALRCLYARWVKLDAPAAWTSFRASDIPKESLHFFLPDSPASRRGMVSARLSEKPRSVIAARMLASWNTVDPAAAQAFAAKLATKGSAEANEFEISSYELDRIAGKRDDHGLTKDAAPPGEAAAKALQQPAGAAERGSALSSAAQQWLRSDPAAACAWIRQLSAQDRRMLSFESMTWGLRNASAGDRAATLAVMLEGQDLTAARIGEGFNDRVLQSDFLTGTARGLNDVSAAIREWTQTDPAAMQKWLSTLPDSDVKPVLAGAAAGALAASDPKAALTLLNQTSGDQQFAVKGLMSGWIEKDAPAALAWAAKIEDSFLRDACREMAALSLSATDPPLAIETARTVSDPAIRQKIYDSVRTGLSWNPVALTNLQTRFPGVEWTASQQPKK